MCPQFNSGSRHQYFSAGRTALFLFGDSLKTYILRNLRFPVCRDYDLLDKAAAKLGLASSDIRLDEIIRRNVDTRRKGHPIYDFTLRISFCSLPRPHHDLSESPESQDIAAIPINVSDDSPLIVGMGPAGLFCALAMVQNGLRPILHDRGDALETRASRVERFWRDGTLDPDSNVQFGEGGAGAFSDGKLTSRSGDRAIRRVFAELIRFGATETIAWEALPHLGTDGIRRIVQKIREFLISKGCQFHYRSMLSDIELKDGVIARAKLNGEWISPENMVLGIGNSARETFRLLARRGVVLEAKPFAIGVRIEQKQAEIDRIVYGSGEWQRILGPASYRLTAPTGFTFCMCPGGYVIAASSEQSGCVTNGMSYAARQADHCNSAVVTSVGDADYGTGLWAGMELQASIEAKSFREGFLAPAQTAWEFISGDKAQRNFTASYKPGVYAADLASMFPVLMAERLKSSLTRFEKILPGFTRDAVLIAPETRTSSPLRIIRDKVNGNAAGIANLFPIGEGGGYAGGIMSSAADGWRLGERFCLKS